MKIKFTNKFLLIVTVLLCSSCATTYQASGFLGGGYSEFRISQDSFVVSFTGNAFTSSQTVLKYALRRASELTVHYSFHYFSIVAIQNTTTRSFYTTSSSISEITQPGVDITIKCYTDKPCDVECINAHEYLKFNSSSH